MNSLKLRWIFVFAIGAMTFIFGVNFLTQISSKNLPVSFSAMPALAQVAANGDFSSVADVAERVIPSVVNISSERVVSAPESPFEMHPFFREFFRQQGEPRKHKANALGSGVIVSSDGLVLTNNHVVDKADEIWVVLSNNEKFKATVLGTDPKSDLAVLRLKGAPKLRPLPFGDSTRMRLGDAVLAVGNPFGVGQTVTMGIVSAKGRANVGIVDYEDFIQTDAAINPGNSGGALVNMNGQLIGINTAILSRSGGYQGVGFAIPSNMAKPIMDSLIKSGKVVRGWLGVVIQEVTPELAKALKLPTTEGVLISDVDPKGPAQRAGFKRGDLVVKVDGTKVASPGNLRNVIAAAGAKGKVSIEFYRHGKINSTDVRLAELPANLGGTGPEGSSELGGLGKPGGLTVAPITPVMRKKYDLPPRLDYGVVIESVKRDSPAAEAGLQPGDVILEVNRVTIDSVKRFSQLFAAANERVLLLVYRQGSTSYLILPKK
ncbi:MAG: DegQ family serine endoprotease [Pseudomonadota bacterium]